MILFFGPPGSGKSVQGDLLVKNNNNLQWLSTGQIFRASQDPEVHARLATGELIDDELTNRVLTEALGGISSNTVVVLDGYPRNTDQAKWLLENLSKFNRSIHCAIEFSVSSEEILKRLESRGRDGETQEIIQKRLDVYKQQTQPMLDYLKDSDVSMYEINGVGTVDEVHQRIQAIVDACIQE
jgi:adenylate kinase